MIRKSVIKTLGRYLYFKVEFFISVSALLIRQFTF